MSELEAVEQWAGALLAKLEPGERRKLARLIGRTLATSQRSRVKAQQNPDGTAFEPRKARPTMRDRKGAMRRKAKAGPMFAKLSRANELAVVEATPDGVSVGFRRARSSAIARVHQEGLVDQVERKNRNSARIRYPSRRLLGLSTSDRERLAEQLTTHLAGGGR